jgi:branched-chain amino acid transport system permease protein
MSAYALSVLAYLGINVLLAYSMYLPLATHRFSLGTAGFMAIGAYVASVLTVSARLPLAAGLLGGMLASAGAGVLVGFPALRLRGLYLAMASLAFGEMVRTFFLNFEPTGAALGFRGMSLVPEWAIWACVLVATALLVALSRSRFGLAMRATRDDDLAAELVGLNPVAIRVSAFGLGAGVAGLAGGLYAHYALFVEPGQFGFLLSIDAALMVVLGGSFSILGPALGASIFTLLPELLRDTATWRDVAFGSLVLGLLLMRPTGLMPRGRVTLSPRSTLLPPSPRGTFSPSRGRGVPAGATEVRQDISSFDAAGPTVRCSHLRPRFPFSRGWEKGQGVEGNPSPRPLLEVKGLSRSFGGVQAIRSLDLTVNAGEIFGIIGPNGAGKTTLFNLITGVLAPNGGSIELAGDRVVGLSPRVVVERGIARTFQNLRLFHSLTTLENVLVAQRRLRSATEWLSADGSPGDGEALATASLLLAQLRLADKRDSLAGALAYGQQRRLEIARALATGLRLLLVDEPAAGMNAVESAELMADLRWVRDQGVTILLIEHDMTVVMGLCDRIAVLDFGEKIAEGTPSEIRRDRRVLDAYFGEWEEVG